MGDYRATTGESAPTSMPQRQRRRFLRLSAAVAALALAVVAGFFIHVERSFLANGYVTTEEYAEVRPATVGIIADIRAQSGASVTQGQVLATLDITEEQAAVDEAQSRVLQMESELARRQAEIVEENRRHQELIAIARLRPEYRRQTDPGAGTAQQGPAGRQRHGGHHAGRKTGGSRT